MLVLCAVFFLHIPQAQAHKPYVKPLSDWMTYNGRQYRVEGWYGDGIFFTDPVRVFVRQQDGSVVAISGLGKSPVLDCPDIEKCRLALDGYGGANDTAWELHPDKMTKITTLDEFGYSPRHWAKGETGFVQVQAQPSTLWFLLPVALYLAFRLFRKKRNKKIQEPDPSAF